MVSAPLTLPDLNGLNPDELKALILAQHQNLVTQHEALVSRETEIENLKLLILKLRRMQFGRKSEKLDHQIQQLELRLEDLETAQTESVLPEGGTPSPSTRAPRRPARR